MLPYRLWTVSRIIVAIGWSGIQIRNSGLLNIVLTPSIVTLSFSHSRGSLRKESAGLNDFLRGAADCTDSWCRRIDIQAKALEISTGMVCASVDCCRVRKICCDIGGRSTGLRSKSERKWALRILRHDAATRDAMVHRLPCSTHSVVVLLRYSLGSSFLRSTMAKNM